MWAAVTLVLPSAQRAGESESVSSVNTRAGNCSGSGLGAQPSSGLWHCPDNGISALGLPALLSVSQCQTLWLHWEEITSSLQCQSPGGTKMQEQLFADFLLRPARC